MSRRTILNLIGAVGALGVALLTTSAQAQPGVRPAASARDARDARPQVHRMEIYNGADQRVRYFGTGLSSGDDIALRDLERTENELSYARNLLEMKREYAQSERILEPHRRQVQQELYGLSTTQTSYTGLGFGGFGYAPYTYPYLAPAAGYAYAGYGAAVGYPRFGGFGGGLAGFASSDTTINRSLANGVGSEGVVKEAMASRMAQQATPEYATAIEARRDRAVAQLSDSPSMRVALGLPKPSSGGGSGGSGEIRAVGFEQGPIVITLKGGEKVVGSKLEQTKDWIILTGNGRTTRLRPDDVIRIDEQQKGGVGPAVDK
jgi:hypothetical protein